MSGRGGGAILDEIVALRRADIEASKRRVPRAALEGDPGFRDARRGFVRALRGRTPAVIAEVKKASPSRGVIREDFDPLWIARRYASAGAAAVSVLTEERHFQGKLDFMRAIRSHVDVPILRKDFIVDEYQIVEARSAGADAILLIAACLSDAQLARLHEFARMLELDVLVEVHTRHELERSLQAGATLIGVNNRNLETFETKLEIAEELAAFLPAGILSVAESGIHGAGDMHRMLVAGYSSFLIGEALMRARDPGERLRKMLTEVASLHG